MGGAHADGLIAQLEGYIDNGYELVLTSHYTPEDMKDAKTKTDYLKEIKSIALECKNAAEMKEKVSAKYPDYSGENYLDMTVGFFFPKG